jgi:hypothetical protein
MIPKSLPRLDPRAATGLPQEITRKQQILSRSEPDPVQSDHDLARNGTAANYRFGLF